MKVANRNRYIKSGGGFSSAPAPGIDHSWVEDSDLSNHVNLAKYSNRIPDPFAEINLAFLIGSLRYMITGKIVYVYYDFVIDAENISDSTNNLGFAMTVSMPYLPTQVGQDNRGADFTISADLIGAPGGFGFRQIVVATTNDELDFGQYPFGINVGQHINVFYKGQLFFEIV